MTNYEAIIRMTPERMEQFLDQVYLTGLNNGMYVAKHDDDEILDLNPCDDCWVAALTKEVTEFGFDEEGDEYMLYALVEAIFRNAGIPISED